jgi:hypothetical protein
MKGQRNFDMSGTSRLSLADAGLGAAAGFLVPVIANRVLDLYATTTITDSANRRLAAAATGIVVAIPLYYWRGMAPALVAAALALVYGASGYVTDWVNTLGTSTEGARRLGSGRSVGLLQQASRQVGALQQVGGRGQPARRRARSFEFQGTAD